MLKALVYSGPQTDQALLHVTLVSLKFSEQRQWCIYLFYLFSILHFGHASLAILGGIQVEIKSGISRQD